MIKLEGVSFAYGDYPTVRDVSYELKDHQITTLIGPNGSGKSTLFKLLTRSLKPNKGQILLNGEDIWTYPPKNMLKMSPLFINKIKFMIRFK